MLRKIKFLAIYVAIRFYLEPKNRKKGLKPASTILFVRDGEAGLEVFMVARHHQIDFASGALVFPGGKVDEGDNIREIREYCDGIEGLSDDDFALQVAAIREGFEECGLLLAREEGQVGLINAKRLEELDKYREPMNNHQITLIDFLKEQKLRLACDELHSYSRWITPEFMPKRFDTAFYLAKAPLDQVASHDGYESVDSVWINPQQALDDAEAGRRTVIFPTRLNLKVLAEASSVGEAFSQNFSRQKKPILPTLCRERLTVYMQLPEDGGYGVVKETLEDSL